MRNHYQLAVLFAGRDLALVLTWRISQNRKRHTVLARVPFTGVPVSYRSEHTGS